jgi:hypothetical protein
VAQTRARRFIELSRGKPLAYPRVTAAQRTLVDPTLETRGVADRRRVRLTATDWLKLHTPDLFDVVLYSAERNTLEEITQALRNALAHVAEGGFLVVARTLPRAHEQQLERAEFLALQNQTDRSWVGPVWKACLQLLEELPSLAIMTLDMEWGLSIIYEETRFSSAPDASNPTIGGVSLHQDLRDSLIDPLSVVSVEQFVAWLHRVEGHSLPRVYVEDRSATLDKLAASVLRRRDPGIRYVDGGIVLPFRAVTDGRLAIKTWEGGILERDLTFVDGFRSHADDPVRNRSCTGGYYVAPEDIEYRDEEVVYLGQLEEHFGHLLVDGLARWWWLVRNPEYRGRVILVARNDTPLLAQTLTLLAMIGIEQNRVVVVDSPTRFRKVVVPEQSFYRLNAVLDHWGDVYDAISDACRTGSQDRVYLTRQAHASSKPNNPDFGEEYFSQYFSDRGFALVSPETLTLEEQISTITGAKEIAFVDGTLAHLALFSRPGTKITLLKRTARVETIRAVELAMRQTQVSLVDVTKNVLPVEHVRGPFLFAPTPQWLDYCHDAYPEADIPDPDGTEALQRYLLPWLRSWTRTYSSPKAFRKFHKQLDDKVGLLDRLSRYTLDTPIDVAAYRKLLSD